MWSVIDKFIRFCFVGLLGLLVDFGLTFLLKEKIKCNKYVANSVGFVVAATSNYILNRIWTFHSENPNILLEYGSFFFVALIGLGINNSVIYMLNDRLKWNFYWSKLIAIGVTTFWNFTANYLFTFAV